MCGCHTKCDKHASMCIHGRNTASIHTGQPHPMIKNCLIAGWPDTKDELNVDLKPYWSYRDELAVIDSVILKGRCIVIPNSLRQPILEQLYINHMGIEKTKLLACESVYWSSINSDIDNFIKTVLCVFIFSRCSQRRSSIMTYHLGHGKSLVQTYSILKIKTTYAL